MKKPTKAPSKTEQTRWIAERVLVRSDAVGGRVLVRVGIPEIDHPYTNWRCPIVIEGLGEEMIKSGCGDDSMSALQNALTGIRCILEQSGVPLRWEGWDEDYTGFPKDLPWGYGLAFYQRIDTMIEKTIEAEREKLNRELRERREALSKARKKPPTK